MATTPNSDYVKEKIKFLTEIFKLVFALFLVIASGTVALIVKQSTQSSRTEVGFAFMGMLFVVLLINILNALYKSIRNNLDKLNR